MSQAIGTLAAALFIVASSFAAAQPATSNHSANQTTTSGTSSQLTASEQEAKNALEKAGYTQVRDVKSSAEGISAKALKDGRQVSLVVDSSGKIVERTKP